MLSKGNENRILRKQYFCNLKIMKMYKKQFEIRWSDIDANGHLANSAYTNFMSHARMAFFAEQGFSMPEIMKHNIGPVVFYGAHIL
jgi:acyl-CoA thioesterase FadM